MKIAIAFHSCMDLGGIINHTEQLAGGLKDLGHEVRLIEMVYRDSVNGMSRDYDDLEVGPTGIPFNQGKGWKFGKRDRFPYKTGAGLQAARTELSSYDMVIWTVPVVPKNKSHIGNDQWPHLYDLPKNVKQVAIIHDGNCRNGSPHILHVADQLSGLACVHACAFGGAAHVPVQRAMILNPQYQPIRDRIPWDRKHSGFVNMQTFKAWKHVHELIQAIAYMPTIKDGELREVAGKGIEYQYMTSEDKCKENYFHGESDEWFSGMKFWEAALGNGMTHHDYWTTKVVDDMLRSARVLVDPSWSKRYSQVGGHWNRVVVDAMIRGCVPVAQERGMGTELFLGGVHYVDVGRARDPQDYADIVLDTSNMTMTEAQGYQSNILEVLPQFERSKIAQEFIDLANGNLDTETGTPDSDVMKKCEDLLLHQYGII